MNLSRGLPWSLWLSVGIPSGSFYFDATHLKYISLEDFRLTYVHHHPNLIYSFPLKVTKKTWTYMLLFTNRWYFWERIYYSVVHFICGILAAHHQQTLLITCTTSTSQPAADLCAIIIRLYFLCVNFPRYHLIHPSYYLPMACSMIIVWDSIFFLTI